VVMAVTVVTDMVMGVQVGDMAMEDLAGVMASAVQAGDTEDPAGVMATTVEAMAIMAEAMAIMVEAMAVTEDKWKKTHPIVWMGLFCMFNVLPIWNALEK
jgi:hypothetical protein